MAYRILLVDDSPAMLRFIERVINISGVEVSEFHKALNGNLAFELLQNHSVDLILTDINMPECSGDELVRRLQADPRLQNIPVIVVSTDSTRARVDQITQLGAKAYIAKPFTPEQLGSLIGQVLEDVNV